VSLVALLFEPRAGTTGGDPLIHAGTVVVTRDELTARVHAIRDALRGIGVTQGTTVAVMLGNNPGAIATLFAVWAAGGVHVPLNPRLTDDEVGRLLVMIVPETDQQVDPILYAPSLGREIESEYGKKALEGLQTIGFKFEEPVG